MYPQPVSIGRTLPGLRGPGVTTRVASEQVFLAEDAPQLAVEVRSPTPSRCAWEPATCFALRCLCLAARRDSLRSGALGVASQKTARNMQGAEGGGVFLFPEPAISVTNLFFKLEIGHAGHAHSCHVIFNNNNKLYIVLSSFPSD